MKTKFTFLFLLLCLSLFTISSNGLQAQSLAPTEKATLLSHLTEVNKEWQNHKDHLENPTEMVSFQKDQERIQLHLALVQEILSSQSSTDLTKVQKEHRQHLLTALGTYHQVGVFPVNSFHTKRTPYFVDARETACAVAHLMRIDGQGDLVQQISEENNFAYLVTLQKQYPQIKQWASNNGFTTEELAWIQPGYPPTPQTWEAVGGGGGVIGKINVMETSADGNLLYMAGDFSSIDGFDANSIVAFDGDNWYNLAEGVTGEILDMDIGSDTKLYISGNFVVNGDTEYSNVASWDGNSWTGLQKGNMEGEVRTIYVKNNNIYIGGDFEKVEGEEMPYLAFRPLNGANADWTNAVEINNQTISNAFAVNGPVNTIIVVEDSLMIAGEFTQTAPSATNTAVNKIDTEYIASWFDNNWQSGFSGSHQPVITMAYADETLYLGGNEEGENTLSSFSNGEWNYVGFAKVDNTNSEGVAYGILDFDDSVYLYGNSNPDGIIIIHTSGFTQIGGTGGNGGGGAQFDKTVRSCGVLNNEVYFAGDFTTPDFGVSIFNGLVRSSLGAPPTAVVAFEEDPIEIYTNQKQLYLNYEDLSESVQLNLYNLQGQLIHQQDLATGSWSGQEDLTHLSDGIYVYELTNGRERVGGKLSVF